MAGRRRRHGKHNKKGRDENGSFVAINRCLMREDAYRALHPVARQLYTEIKYFYAGNNNGEIYLSVRMAAQRLGVNKTTAAKYLKQLEEHGFIVCTQKGAFDWKSGHATTWRLTEYACNGNPATKDFRHWRSQEKKPVPKIGQCGPKNWDQDNVQVADSANDGPKKQDQNGKINGHDGPKKQPTYSLPGGGDSVH